jgi:hypothetical protein
MVPIHYGRHGPRRGRLSPKARTTGRGRGVTHNACAPVLLSTVLAVDDTVTSHPGPSQWQAVEPVSVKTGEAG